MGTQHKNKAGVGRENKASAKDFKIGQVRKYIEEGIPKGFGVRGAFASLSGNESSCRYTSGQSFPLLSKNLLSNDAFARVCAIQFQDKGGIKTCGEVTVRRELGSEATIPLLQNSFIYPPIISQIPPLNR
jgi:hypothetical protein